MHSWQLTGTVLYQYFVHGKDLLSFVCVISFLLSDWVTAQGSFIINNTDITWAYNLAFKATTTEVWGMSLQLLSVKKITCGSRKFLSPVAPHQPQPGITWRAWTLVTACWTQRLQQMALRWSRSQGRKIAWAAFKLNCLLASWQMPVFSLDSSNTKEYTM